MQKVCVNPEPTGRHRTSSGRCESRAMTRDPRDDLGRRLVQLQLGWAATARMAHGTTQRQVADAGLRGCAMSNECSISTRSRTAIAAVSVRRGAQTSLSQPWQSRPWWGGRTRFGLTALATIRISAGRPSLTRRVSLRLRLHNGIVLLRLNVLHRVIVRRRRPLRLPCLRCLLCRWRGGEARRRPLCARRVCGLLEGRHVRRLLHADWRLWGGKRRLLHRLGIVGGRLERRRPRVERERRSVGSQSRPGWLQNHVLALILPRVGHRGDPSCFWHPTQSRLHACARPDRALMGMQRGCQQLYQLSVYAQPF